MDIQTLKIDKLKPSKYNPRRDLQPGDADYEKLKKSIIEFSAVEPIVWNKKTGNVVGGHQRLKVLKALGHDDVEVSVVNLPEDKEKALNLALNKIQGDWDLPKLSELVSELSAGDFDMEAAGFDEDEIGKLLDPRPGSTPDEEVPKIKKGLREGIMIVIGWYQTLVLPGTPEFNKFSEFAGTKKRWSEEDSKSILKKIHDAI